MQVMSTLMVLAKVAIQLLGSNRFVSIATSVLSLVPSSCGLQDQLGQNVRKKKSLAPRYQETGFKKATQRGTPLQLPLC